ncbi:MAG: hypothetical protein JXB34_05335 [Bacteroidales bacterium]|nr:hypothetical protein [Bacteroidales bacterium]
MKRKILSGAILLTISAIAFSQAVSDRNVIPVAVNLNQVLRMNITNGGNIEFTFNTIDAYKAGLSGDAATSGSANDAASEGIYQTDFTVASSTRWNITYGAEMATFIGTDNPANTLALDNVGFTIVNNGVHVFETGGAQGTTATEELWSTPTDAATEVAALEAYPVVLIEDNNSATQANAGDITDNSFSLVWRCGTTEAGAIVPMNAQYLIDQSPSPTPDRYVVNVIFELGVD